MSPSTVPWETLLTEAVTMFLLLLAVGVALVGVWTLLLHSHR